MQSEQKHFKGWAVPGPLPAGELDAERARLPDDQTLDALSGHYRIFQLKNGHRFSTDDLVVAWYGTSWAPSARTALDLGSGIGTVGMISAWRLQGARFVTVEAQAISVELARKSAAFNGLSSRYEIRQGDFRDEGVLHPDEKFDLITGSPPYFPVGSGIEGDHPQKIACRFELRGTVADYCETASRHLGWGGLFACVFPTDPPEQSARVEEGARNAGLKIVRRRPIVLREGNTPLLSVFAMMKLEHLPPDFRQEPGWTEPPLVIRTREGKVHPEYSALKLAIGFPP